MKTQVILEKHFKKFKENKHNVTLKRIKYKGNGDMQFGTPQRMVWAKQVVEATGKDGFVPTLEISDGTYPDVERLYPDLSDTPIILPTKDLQNLLDPLLGKVDESYMNAMGDWKTRKKTISENVAISIESMGITLKPVERNNPFVEASLDYNTEAEETISFAINTKYLKEALMLFKQLKHKEVYLTFRSPIYPILLHAENLDYLIAPVRRG